MKRIIMAALLLASSALGAPADSSTYVFKDALKPSGHERGADVRHADGRACGVSGISTCRLMSRLSRNACWRAAGGSPAS
jgi:hypothetical protein